MYPLEIQCFPRVCFAGLDVKSGEQGGPQDWRFLRWGRFCAALSRDFGFTRGHVAD